MNRRGFTLVEVLVAMVLAGIVTASIYQLLVSNQRVYRLQTERADLNADLRAALAILPSELREISATDTTESDLISMTSSAVTFKAMRTLHFLCEDPPTGTGSSGTIVVYRALQYGLRALDATRDSILVFAEGDTSARGDNYWVHANASGVSATVCPDGSAGMAISLNGVSPAGGLDDVMAGAPARGFEVEEVRSYPDANGDLWLGLRQYGTGSGWGTTQPLLGPLAASGLQFSYFDSVGATTAIPTQVFSIGLTVIGSTDETVVSGADTRRLEDTLTTRIAIRNNAWSW
jgi:prepilin-type N-terminal cleavage/methylation domain-containing protein